MSKDEDQSENIRVQSSEEFNEEMKQRQIRWEKEREKRQFKRDELIAKLSEKFGEETIQKAFEAQAKGEVEPEKPKYKYQAIPSSLPPPEPEYIYISINGNGKRFRRKENGELVFDGYY